MTSTRISGRNTRGEKKGMVPFLLLLSLVVGLGLPSAVVSQQVEIDMDRNTAGVQANLNTDTGTVQGAVVVTGANDAGRYAVQILMTNDGGGNSIVCAGTSAAAAAGPGAVADGGIGVSFVCNDGSVPNSITRANLFSANAAAVGGQVILFNFDLQLACTDGQTISLAFQTSTNNSTLGVNVNGTARTFGQGSSNPIPTVGGSVTCGDGQQVIRCADSGYYILDGLGGRHSVGGLPVISGPVYFGTDIAKDMEFAGPNVSTVTDVLVLDKFGAVSQVANAAGTPSQSFTFPDGTSQAVDVEITNDNAGFWVLRADGGIYAAGSALAGGADGSQPIASTPITLDFPFGGSVPRNSNPLTPASDNARVRAVGFVVVQTGDPLAPSGIVVLDSQGGHYILAGSGTNTVDDDVSGSILNGPGGSSSTAYPFWQGLDIGRDIELHPSGGATDGVGIYDGFGGVHPVPVNNHSSGVQFLRNEGTGASTVGLPYLVLGFDDPATVEDDVATNGIDVESIFKDLEFCTIFGSPGKGGAVGTGGGAYVLDAFGGVFVLGNTRLNGPDVSTPGFNNGPYFFPNPIVRDLEPAGSAVVTSFVD